MLAHIGEVSGFLAMQEFGEAVVAEQVDDRFDDIVVRLRRSAIRVADGKEALHPRRFDLAAARASG